MIKKLGEFDLPGMKAPNETHSDQRKTERAIEKIKMWRLTILPQKHQTACPVESFEIIQTSSPKGVHDHPFPAP